MKIYGERGGGVEHFNNKWEILKYYTVKGNNYGEFWTLLRSTHCVIKHYTITCNKFNE